MVNEKNKPSEVAEISVEEKLRALYQLQKVHSELDKINILRGELPLEVRDLEDEIAGLETRIHNYREEIKALETALTTKNTEIVNSQNLIKKYKEQQDNVRNNREYDSLSKEIEYQTLEIELSEKRIREFMAQVDERNQAIERALEQLESKNADLVDKKKELEDISVDTNKDEEQLIAKAKQIEEKIEPRLLSAYSRIRNSVYNRLAVVTVQRDACGGCFNNIPPQRQLDIRSRKKIIVCEYCGRIFVDDTLA
ncbi:MAG: zinc ribbon domain-containing protein [Bacteroidales bacterium]